MDDEHCIRGIGPGALLARLTALGLRSPTLTIFLGLVLTAASLVVARDIEYRTDNLDLAPHEDEVVRRYLDFREEFGTVHRVLCILEGPRAREAADTLARELEQEPEQVRSVTARVDVDAHAGQILYTLEQDRVRRLREQLQDARFELAALARSPQVATLFERLARPGRRQDAPSAEEVRGLRDLVAYLAGDEEVRRPDPTDLIGGGGDETLRRPRILDEQGYQVSLDGKKIMVSVQARRSGGGEDVVVPFVAAVRRRGDEVARRLGVGIRYSGLPVLKVEEAAAAEESLGISSLASLVGVSLFFLAVFQVATVPLLALLGLVASVLWTLAWARLTVGHLTVVSAAFTAILIGLGIDYAIHLIARFDILRTEGHSAEVSMVRAAAETAPGILSGCLTTTAAFFSMFFTGFPAYQGLGVVAGGGLLLALVETFWLLPAIVILHLGRRPDQAPPPPPLHGAFEALGHHLTAQPALGPLGALALSLACLIPAAHTSFDHNVLLLNEPASDARDLLEAIFQDYGFFPVQDALVVSDLAQVERASRLLEARAEVGVVSTLAGLVPADPARNQREIQALRGIVEGLGTWEPGATPDGARRRKAVDDFLENVRRLRLHFLVSSAPGGAWASQQLLERLEALQAAPQAEVDRRDQALMGDLEDLVGALRSAVTSQPNRLEDVGEDETAGLWSTAGRFAVLCTPAQDVRRHEEARRFRLAVRAVAEEVGCEATGEVLLTQRMGELLDRGFDDSVTYAVLAVALFLYFDLRRLDLVALVMATVGVGILGLEAAMAMFSVPLNAANFVALPLLLGVGVDNAVHLIHPWKAGVPAERTVSLSGRPIFLNAITSMIGFGGLMTAPHPGLRDLGWTMTVGIFWCGVAAFLLVPGCLRLLELPRDHWRRYADQTLSHRL